MGWFDEQIKQRIKADDDAFSDAFTSMAGVVMGRSMQAAILNDREKTKSAVNDIMKFFHVKSVDLPEEIKDINEQLEYLFRPSGIMRRKVELKGEWYREAVGAFLTTHRNGSVVALIPHGVAGYTFFDYISGKYIKLNKKTAKLLDVEAICFYKPLPVSKIGIRDLLVYIAQTLSFADYALAVVATIVITLIGLLMPKINSIIFSNVIESKSTRLFIAITVLLTSVTLASLLIGIVKSMLMLRIQNKASIAVQAASMMRVLSLPAHFFREFSSGELSSRMQGINNLCGMLINAILSIGLTSLFSLVYISQIFMYASALVVPALCITFATILFSLLSTVLQMKVSKRIMELEAKESGIVYSFITGVQKLKLAGAEKRAFAKWAAIYCQKAKLLFDPPMLLKLNGVINTAISLIGGIILYLNAVKTKVSVADYLAFNTAYSMVSAAFMSLSGIALTVANIKPVLELAKPILETLPEVSVGKKMVTRISGSIELNNVSFRYSESMPLIINDLSLKINPGQYVALVGRTGCGKSTLVRLLLGFEAPQKGAIYYDGMDISTIDLKSLRRRIGVVMQNGKLFAGDIFSNITISAPWLDINEAWEVAEMAGIADDIRDMPMGMNTMISEGSGGVSGGQRQRLMISRAIAPKPRVLIFDEATSALDNITQKKVTESLSKLKCTRIVIAHRLSTIRECNRIIVLDGGKIMEDGTYDELIKNNGFFAELVSRQKLTGSK